MSLGRFFATLKWMGTGPPVKRSWHRASFILMLSLAVGCRQDMQNQPKIYPLRGTNFYVDGRSARPQVANTVARGQLHEDDYFYTGLEDGKELDVLPFPVSMALLRRGQERYNIYCTPCHSRVGNGEGIIVQRGFKKASDLCDAKRRAEPLGHYVNVILHGHNSMPDFASELSPADRWAVAAYIRALQLSQSATPQDIPLGTRLRDLGEIEVSEGFPKRFAERWPDLPFTVKPAPKSRTMGNDGSLHK
jgi:mono/diheme cytochrome c family protein